MSEPIVFISHITIQTVGAVETDSTLPTGVYWSDSLRCACMHAQFRFPCKPTAHELEGRTLVHEYDRAA